MIYDPDPMHFVLPSKLKKDLPHQVPFQIGGEEIMSSIMIIDIVIIFTGCVLFMQNS